MRFYAIPLPFTSKQMKQWLDEDDFFRVRHSIDKAIKVARLIGCDVIALGQYTSIVTRNATTLQLPHVGLTTGNSYTIALALEAIEHAVRERGSTRRGDPARWSAPPATSARPAPRFSRRGSRATLLLGSSKPSAVRRLARCRRGCRGRTRRADPSALRQAHVVLAAANAPDAVSGRRAVCAAAPSSAISRCRRRFVQKSGAAARRPDDRRRDCTAAVRRAPRHPGFPLPPGQVYGCMAEAMLLGLEGVRDATFTGMLPAEHVFRLAAMAKRHGFALAEYKTHATM